MDVNRILSELDAEIARLQQIRTALAGAAGTPSVSAPKRGRPKGSKNATSTVAAPKRKRQLSPEGRKRIADAMKRRWAERRKDTGR
jgi:hypothetical protein